jgi:hypothetical protein
VSTYSCISTVLARLEQGLTGTRPPTARSVAESAYTPDDAVLHPLRDDGTTRYLSKAFWNLESANRRVLAEYETQHAVAAPATNGFSTLSLVTFRIRLSRDALVPIPMTPRDRPCS